MKKVLSLVIVSAFALTMAACTKKATEEVPPADPAATTAPAPEQTPEKK
ncbi:MAG: hypothetical protein V1647_05990 [Pseudomonadota bacterium]